ncbi:MAG: hypothetical protein ACK5N2_00850 [bacterium]|uniref:Uncharacterized protein n=1 Tax=Microcystis flos-aquae FACHB-1344 TaxID=2692899 RepID=A0ABR8HZJ8_9CHRO|nr:MULTISPECIES: hypothetical protein [Microcystis]MBD2624321.1 hypothetical protein [Microcystis flos-aquae FACHB-1344]MCA2703152.1 hypothetical protein [Microcystis sp. M179S2]
MRNPFSGALEIYKNNQYNHSSNPNHHGALNTTLDELFKKLTPQRVASLTRFPFILDALSALNTI